MALLLEGLRFASLGGGVVRAQDHTVASSASAPALTREQAQQLLGVLDNDAKRHEFMTTLRNFSAMQSPAALPEAAHSKVGLRSESLGDQMLGSMVAFGHKFKEQAHGIVGTVGDFRELREWIEHVLHTSDDQVEIVRIVLRVAVLLIVGALLFSLARLVLKRPRAALVHQGHQRNVREEASVHREIQDVSEAVNEAVSQDKGLEPLDHTLEQQRLERMRHQGAWSKLVLALRRFPYAVGLFVLDVIPLAVFPLVAFAMEALDNAGDNATAMAVEAVAWIGCLAGFAFVAFVQTLFAPRQSWRRLVVIDDTAADFWFTWLRRLGLTVAFGVTVLTVFTTFGMPQSVVAVFGKLLALLIHLQVLFMILRGRAPVWNVCERIAQHSRAPTLIRFVGHSWWIVAIFFEIALWLVWAADIRGGYVTLATLFIRTCVALAFLRIVSIVAYGGLERLFRAIPVWASLNDNAHARITRYYPAAQHVVTVLLAVLTVLIISVAWGAAPLRVLFGQDGLGQHVFSSLLTILVALLIGVSVWEAVSIATERHIQRLAQAEDGVAKAARFRTLQPMLRIILLVVLAAVVGLTVLSEIGVNAAPLLASASIFGVALGFGSQKLVQDFISGIFLLMENALTVGDAVTLSGTYGVVEKLSLRTVHVRANDGSMNIFPFSSLNQITNYNRDFARAIIVAEVGYSADTDDVVKAIHDITSEMRADPDFKNLIIDDFQMWGVDSLGDWSVTVRGTLPTTTAGRWPVQRQFYRRMKKCFEARGIEIPFPTRTMEISGLERLTDYRGPRGETLGVASGSPAKGTDTRGLGDERPEGRGAAGREAGPEGH